MFKTWIKKREARPRQCPLLNIFKRNNLCEKNMRKKYRSKKAWDKKSWNHSGSQQKVWHYLWFLLTFGKNSLIHYGRWIQQEGLVFNHQNTSATPFWPSQCHTAKKEGKQALQIGVKLWSCRFVGLLPYWDFCFKNFSARSDFSLLALMQLFGGGCGLEVPLVRWSS